MYKITITKIDKDVPFKNREYKDLGTKNEDGETEYGYVYFNDTHDVTAEVYEQTVEELDLSEVVAVVNGLKK